MDPCYCCGLPVRDGEPVYQLIDNDGLVFYAHQVCAEEQMYEEPAERSES